MQAILLLNGLDVANLEVHSISLHLDAHRLVLDGDIPLKSPLSIGQGGAYGPVFSYLIALFYFISPSYLTLMIVLGVSYILSTAIIFFIGLRFFDERTGWIGAILFAFSPPAFLGPRFPLMANFVPLLGLLFIVSLLYLTVDDNWVAMVGLLGTLGILLQMHYAAYAAIPVALAAIIYALLRRSAGERRKSSLLLGVLVFVLLFTPYIIGEFHDDFVDTKIRLGILGGDLELLDAQSDGQSYAGILFDNALRFVRMSSNNPYAFQLGGCPPGDLRTLLYDGMLLIIHIWFMLAVLAYLPWYYVKGKKRGGRLSHPLTWIILCLVWAGVMYLSIPPLDAWWVHSHFFFLSIVLLTAVFSGAIINAVSRYRVLITWLVVAFLTVYALTATLVILDVRSAGLGYCAEDATPVPFKKMYQLQEILVQDFGPRATRLELVEYAWPVIGLSLVDSLVEELGASNERTFVFKENAFPDECFPHELDVGVDGLRVVRTDSSPLPTKQVLTLDVEHGWEEIVYLDDHWRKLEQSVGIEDTFSCASCVFLEVEYLFPNAGDENLFVRFTYDTIVPNASDRIYLFLSHRALKGVIYFNGHLLGAHPLGLSPTTLSFDVTDLLSDEGNLLALELQHNPDELIFLSPFFLTVRDCEG